MNLVTRGLGKRSGMLVSFGLGRRVISWVDVLTTVFTTRSRAWAYAPPSRPWNLDASRIWEAITASRSWAKDLTTRSWKILTGNRSWLRSRVRSWIASNERSWSDDGD